MLLLVEPGVDVEGLGYEPHQVPVLRKETRIMEHSCLTVVLAVAVGVAVVIPEKEEISFTSATLLLPSANPL